MQVTRPLVLRKAVVPCRAVPSATPHDCLLVPSTHVWPASCINLAWEVNFKLVAKFRTHLPSNSLALVSRYCWSCRQPSTRQPHGPSYASRRILHFGMPPPGARAFLA